MTDTATEGLQPRAKYFVYFIVLVALLAASVSTYVIIDNTKKTNEAFGNANVCINQYPNNLHGSEEDEKSIDFVAVEGDDDAQKAVNCVLTSFGVEEEQRLQFDVNNTEKDHDEIIDANTNEPLMQWDVTRGAHGDIFKGTITYQG